MASQVLSGSSNLTYTNTTGGNVRIIINYMEKPLAGTSISLTWSGVSVNAPLVAIGKNIAYFGSRYSPSGGSIESWSDNAVGVPQTGSASSNAGTEGTLPTELMLASGQSFSASCGAYNIVVIPEAG